MDTVKRLLLLMLVLAVAAGAYVWVGMSWNAWKPPQVVKIQAGTEVTALMPTWTVWYTAGGDKETKALLLRDGDYLIFVADNAFPVRYSASDGQALTLTVTDWSAKIGNTTVSLLLDKDKKEDGGAWLTAASDQQLADLRTLSIASEIDDGTVVALKRLAAANPNVDLSVEHGDVLARVLPLFHPRVVFGFGGEPDAGVLKALANQPQIEMLLIAAAEAGSFDLLPKLPKLHTLLIGGWDVKKAGPLPDGLSALKSLLIMDADGLTDLKPLGGAAAGLEELSLINLNNFTDLSGIEKMTGLRTLVLGSDKLGDLSSLASLKSLRWVGLPPKTSQEQFAAFVSAHPNLAILDMTGNHAVKDLKPLETLKGMYGLILDGPYDSLNTVEKLASLRFVGISKKTWEAMPEQVAAVRKALPDALVVPVGGLCLGSGWILLLVPVPFVAWWMRLRSSSRKERAA
jgi:hypothetical protein